MKYTPCWKQIGITIERYNELLNFCRQYPGWKREANSLLGVKGLRIGWIPQGNRAVDPVSVAAERREKLLSKISLVEDCAKAISGGEWYDALMQHICYKKTHECIDPALLPTSDRNSFYKQRRLFFELLDKMRD